MTAIMPPDLWLYHRKEAPPIYNYMVDGNRVYQWVEHRGWVDITPGVCMVSLRTWRQGRWYCAGCGAWVVWRAYKGWVHL